MKAFLCSVSIFLSVALGSVVQAHSLSATTADYIKGTVKSVYIANNGGTEVLIISLDPASMYSSGSGQTMTTNTRNGDLVIDTTIPFYKDWLTLAVFYLSSGQMAMFQLDSNSRQIGGYNVIKLIADASVYSSMNWTN